MKMRKLVAMLMALMMLCCIIPFTSVAAESSVTIDFTNIDNRTYYGTSQQVWEQNGITVTNDKGASTTNVGDYGGNGYPARFYKSSTVTVEYPGMTKMVITGDYYNSKDYAAPWAAIDDANATATIDGTVVTIVFAEAVDSFVWNELSAQARAYDITVYTNGDTPVVPDEPDTPDTPVVPDEPSEPASSATIDFTNIDNRTYYGTSQQVWEQNGITVTNDKGASTTNVGDYGGNGYPARFYKSSTVTVAYPGMTKMVITGDYYNSKDYAAPWAAIDDANATATIDGTVVTIVFAEAVDSFVWNELSAQARAYDITVYTNGDAPVVPDEPDTPDTPVVPDEPEEPGDSTGAAVLDLTNEENRVSHSASQQVWKQNGITVTNDKGASTNNVADYVNPGRFYKNSTVTIEYPGMTAIVIDSVTFDDNDYAAGWAVLDDTNATATVTDGDVIIEFASPVDSITWEKLSSQVRAYTITVYTDGAAPELPDKPETPDTPDVPAGDMVIVTEPDVDVAYKMGLYQTQKSAIYYFTGKMSSFYGATETDVALAVDMYLENADGGYYLYFNDASGAKQYIALVQNGTYYNFTFGATGSVFDWDTELNALCTMVGDELCYMGTYDKYVTMGVLRTSKLQDSDYIARLYTEAGATPDVPPCEHQYDDEYDADCNLCGEIREVPEKPIEYAGDIVVSTVEGSVGDTVSVTVTLPNNPGIISAKVKVHFDTAVLKFVSSEAGEFGGTYVWGDPDLVATNGYVVLNWYDGLNVNNTSELLATLKFEILEGAAEGLTALTLEFSCVDDMFNTADETVYFRAVDGGVQIVSAPDYILGDVDGNGRINNRDLATIQQYITGWIDEIDEKAADVDGNGRINNRDLATIQQYITGWITEM